MPNKLSRFWQELKRRNVFHVITVYAGAAFVILSLVDMVREPFELPNWSFKLVIVILSMGFIIAVILSWIYDIRPEGGVVKTEPADKVKAKEVPKSSNSWKIASYISFLVIVGLIVLNIIPRNRKQAASEILDKSIAVLPFINDSPDDENTYFINGIMEEILLNLQAIKDFQVPGRTSVEQYRNQSKPIPEIANELNVNYIIEGSGQKYGNTIRLRIQLLEGDKGMHIWGESYERVILTPEDVFDIQSEIAQSIAAELKALITPAEKELIENVPTTSLTALNYFQRAREEHIDFLLDNSDEESLANAISLYISALDLDPSYAQAYTGLALAMNNKYYSESNATLVFNELERQIYQDSILTLIDQAMKYDDKLEEAYFVKAIYYNGIRDYDQALEELNKAIEINSNYSWAYSFKSGILFAHQGNWIEGIKSALKAVELEKGPLLQSYLKDLGGWYEVTGFHNKSVGIYNDLLNLTKDTAWYCENMAGIAFCERDWNGYKNWSLKGMEVDSTYEWFFQQLIDMYLIFDEIDSALFYERKLAELFEKEGREYNPELNIGYLYWIKGKKHEASLIFDKNITYLTSWLNANAGWKEFDLRQLSGIYSTMGQNEKALEYLQQFEFDKPIQLWFMIEMEEFPWFRNLKSDPRFQEVVNKLKINWQMEHDKLRIWLEENDML